MKITVKALVQAIKYADEELKAGEGVGLLYFISEYAKPESYALIKQILTDTASAEKG